MKKVLLVALLAIGVSATSFAQGGGRPQVSPAERVTRLKAAVTGITADQETKLTAIYTAAAASQDSLMKALNGDYSSAREKMAPLRAAQTAKIKAVLTADQQKQFDAMPPQGRGMGGGAPRN